MFHQHLLYLKKVYIGFYPLSLVYSLYACENVNSCERPLIFISFISYQEYEIRNVLSKC